MFSVVVVLVDSAMDDRDFVDRLDADEATELWCDKVPWTANGESLATVENEY